MVEWWWKGGRIVEWWWNSSGMVVEWWCWWGAGGGFRLRFLHLQVPLSSPKPPPVTTTTLSDPRCSTHAGEGTDAWSTLWRQLWDESRQMLETSKDEL